MSVRILTVYNVGGTGLNRGVAFEEAPVGELSASISRYYIDSSESDRTEKISDDQLFLIPGLKGSGQDRATAWRAASPHINEIINRFPPTDVNLINYSLCGGTGAAVGPMLSTAIYMSGKAVINQVLESTATLPFAINTMQSYKTMLGLARKYAVPFVTMPLLQKVTGQDSNVNDSFDINLENIRILMSEANHGMDDKDVINFLRYPVKTGTQASLVQLVVGSNRTKFEDMFKGKLITQANIIKKAGAPAPISGATFEITGISDDAVIYGTHENTDGIYFGITGAKIRDRLAEIDSAIESLTRDRDTLNNDLLLFEEGEGSDFIG